MTIVYGALLSFLLDLLLGDPAWMPHPVVYMGKVISWSEKRLRTRFPATEKGEFRAGLLLAVCLPLLTVEDEDRIAEKKLTLSGCMQKCMENGHKYEIKVGNRGIARVTEEQHWKWVFAYYGLKGKPTTQKATPAPFPAPPPPPEPADDPFSGLLDF